MASSILNCFRSLSCFGRTSDAKLLDGAPIVTIDVVNDTKQACYSSCSVSSDSTEKEKHALSFHGRQDSRRGLANPAQSSRTNQALLVTAKGSYTLANDFPYPSLVHENEVIIRNHAVGVNPIDWMSVDYGFCLPEYPWITGREMSGIVEQIGSNVEGLKVGDRVWTSTYYKDRRAGCFQQAVTVPSHTVLPIPTQLTFEQAATLGVAGLTAAMTLWRWLEVPMPHSGSTQQAIRPSKARSNGEYLLVWGGAATTGQFAIQLAHLSGSKVICVASTKTSSLCLSLGASHVVTRNGKSGDEIVAEIRAIAGDSITAAIDLVGSDTAVLCLRAVSQNGRVLFAPLAMMNNTVSVPTNIHVQTVEMKRFVLDQENANYAKCLNAVVQSGSIKMPALEIIDGGLAAIEAALKRVKSGDRSGKKIVVKIS